MTRDEAIAAAREQYTVGSDDNIEIDDSPTVTEGENGFWVQAWVHVAKPDPEGESDKHPCGLDRTYCGTCGEELEVGQTGVCGACQ
jgi:hypothetical protein